MIISFNTPTPQPNGRIRSDKVYVSNERTPGSNYNQQEITEQKHFPDNKTANDISITLEKMAINVENIKERSTETIETSIEQNSK